MQSPDYSYPPLYGQVMRIVDPSDFWIRIGTEEDLSSFNDFEQRLNSSRYLSGTCLDEVKENSMVLISCPRADRNATVWKRGTVIRINRIENTFDIMYIDYGHTEIVQGSSICPEVPKYVQEFPDYCHRCALAWIKPIADSWTGRGIRVFTKLVSRRTLRVELVSFDPSTLTKRVNLYGSEGERSISDQMLEEETGLPTDEEEEYANSISAQAMYEYNLNYDEAEQFFTEPHALSPEAPDFFSERSALSPEAPKFCPENRALSHNTLSPEDPEFCSEPPVLSSKASALSPEAPEFRSEHPALSPEAPAFLEHHADSDDQQEDEIVLPKFNVSALQQRKMLGAEELEKMRNDAVRAERCAEMELERIRIDREMEDLQVASGERQQWGETDLLFSKVGKLYEVDNDGHIEYHKVDPVSLFPEDKGLKLCQDFMPDYDMGSQVMQTEPVKGNEQNADFDEIPTCENNCDLGIASKPIENKQQASFVPQPSGSGEAYWTSEEIEYQKQKSYTQILKSAAACNWVELEAVCAEFYAMVPPEVDHSKEEMKFLMEVLLEDAVKNNDVRDFALDVISSYNNVLTDTEMLNLLRFGAEKFVKLPVAKMPGYHIEFTAVLVKMLFLAFEWSPELKEVVHEFILCCLEKWFIFNKRGSQTGPIQRRLEEMYLGCAEHLLPSCLHVLQVFDPDRVVRIFEEMKLKVLETAVHYDIRQHLLNLLVRFGIPDREDNSCQETSIEPSSKKHSDAQDIPVDGPSDLLASHSPYREGNQLAEDRLLAGRKVSTQDIAVQKEMTLKELVSPDATISLSDSSLSSTKVASPAVGRGLKRQEALERFTKHKYSSPESQSCSSSLKHTNSREFSPVSLSKKTAADEPPIGVCDFSDSSDCSLLSPLLSVSKLTESMAGAHLDVVCSGRSPLLTGTVPHNAADSHYTLQGESDDMFHKYGSSVDALPGKNHSNVDDDRNRSGLGFDTDSGSHTELLQKRRGFFGVFPRAEQLLKLLVPSKVTAEGGEMSRGNLARQWPHKKETTNSNMFSEDDFPQLVPHTKPSQGCVSPPTGELPKLTLKTIAACLIESPEGQKDGQVTDAVDGGEISRQTVGDAKCSANRDFEGSLPSTLKTKAEDSNVSDSDTFVGVEDGQEFVPSDWEDRCSSGDGLDFPEVESPGVNQMDEHATANTDQEYCAEGAGDWLRKNTCGSQNWPIMNSSGDSCVPQKLNTHTLFDSRTPENLKEEDCGHTVADDNPYLNSTSDSQEHVPLSVGEAPPYVRGDLAPESSGGRKGKRKKFRPLNLETVSSQTPLTQDCGWDPEKKICTSCGSEGHIRRECPRGSDHILSPLRYETCDDFLG